MSLCWCWFMCSSDSLFKPAFPFIDRSIVAIHRHRPIARRSCTYTKQRIPVGSDSSHVSPTRVKEHSMRIGTLPRPSSEFWTRFVLRRDLPATCSFVSKQDALVISRASHRIASNRHEVHDNCTRCGGNHPLPCDVPTHDLRVVRRRRSPLRVRGPSRGGLLSRCRHGRVAPAPVHVRPFPS
jgi:hypothetical protein